MPDPKKQALEVLITLIILFLSLFSGPTYGDNHPTSLTVGVKVSAPFVVDDGYQNRQKSYAGTDIDRFKEMYDGHITYKAYDSVPALLNAVETGEVDAAVGALSITAEREGRVDFLLPYMQTGLSYGMVANDSTLDLFLSIIPTLLKALAAILVVNALAGLIFTLVEHKKNDEVDLTWKCVFDGFYWSSATLTTVGYGDVTAKTGLGRLLSSVWMWSGLVLGSSLIGLIMAAITIENNENASFNVFEDKIAVVEGSTGMKYAEKLGQKKNIHIFTSLDDAVKSVADGETDAVIHDKVLLDNVASVYEDVVISERLLTSEFYGFAVAEGAPFKEELNRRLLTTLEN